MPEIRTPREIKQLEPSQAVHFRNVLRQAREKALADAEAFDEIIHVVERIGRSLVCPPRKIEDINGLGYVDYEIIEQAKKSDLAEDIPAIYGSLHSHVSVLFNLVRNARNDAMHQGAVARHLTTHAIELALVLEDSMLSIIGGEAMNGTVSDYMVRHPVCVEIWYPISYIRQQLLVNSFS